MAKYVNQNHLGMRIVYHRVDTRRVARRSGSFHRDAVLQKLQFADHPFAQWVRQEIEQRFNYLASTTWAP